MSTIDIKPTASLIVDQITDSGGNVPNFLDGFTVGGRYLDDSANDSGSTRYLRVIDSSGPPTDSAVFPGLMWYWDSNEYLSIYVSSKSGWRTMKGVSVGGPVSASGNGDWYGDRGIVAGGILDGSRTNVIQYYDISTLGSAADFGDLTGVRNDVGSLTGDTGTRALFCGGKNSNNAAVNIMEYITTTTAGNATDYGDMKMGAGDGPSSLNIGMSDGSRGVFKVGLANGSSYANYLSYVAVATTQNAYDFGDATTNSGRHLGGASDGTYGLYAGGGISGIAGTENKPIDYITIQTAGNASDFGDLVTARGYSGGGCASLTRALFAGGYDKTNSTNTIEYVTIATPGNATDFGDMATDRIYCAASSNSVRGTFNGGTTDWLGTSSNVNSIEYVTIDTTGNGTDFGDLTGTLYAHTSTSGKAA